jgi:hypothetical protein
MRKTLLATLFVLSLALTLQGGGWIDWYVDNTFEGDSLGTEEAPFKTIQEAVAASLASNATFSADTIWIKGTDKPYYGPIEIPNKNAMRLAGYGEVKPEITVTGEVAQTVIKSGDNYASPFYACMPPAQVGLENLIVRNDIAAPAGICYCADVQAWVSWEESVRETPEKMRFGIRNCEFYAKNGNVCFRLRDLDQRHKQELVDADHWSMVWNCKFQGEGDLMHLSSQEKALVVSNTFIGGGRAMVFEGWTNAVYSRLTENVKIKQNLFFNQQTAVLYSGVCDDLEFSHNTCVLASGTHVSLTDTGLDPRSTTYVEDNIFQKGEAAVQFAEESWSEKVTVRDNLFEEVDSYGEYPVVGEAKFVSVDPEDVDFLRPNYDSDADRGEYYLGALAPIPEPACLFAFALVLASLIRRR